MTETILLLFLIVHWVADFVLQTHEQAVNKSKDVSYLTKHTLTYSFVLWIFILGITNGDVHTATKFFLITFAAHTITDFFTSKIVSHYFTIGNPHNGFVVIGVDQILHYLQLYFTFKLLL